MSKLTPLLWIAAGIAGAHGYMFLATEQIHPCKAAEARLIREYGPGVALVLGFSKMLEAMIPPEQRQRELSQNPLYRDPKGRQLIGKMSTVERLGVAGCYLPGVLGWWAVPPFA
jgi:hypothetical protein